MVAKHEDDNDEDDAKINASTNAIMILLFSAIPTYTMSKAHICHTIQAVTTFYTLYKIILYLTVSGYYDQFN